MTGKQILKAFFVLALLLAAISTYFAQGDKSQTTAASSSNAAPRTESTRQLMIDDQLKILLAPVGVNVVEIGPDAQSANHQELEVRWKTPDKSAASDSPGAEAQGQPAQTLSVMGLNAGRGSLPRQRSLELSEEQVLVVAVGVENEMRWWTLMADPRLRRAETAGPNGEISGQTVILSETDFTVSYPADISITELRFYHPHWTGTRFTLESIGSTPVR
jgi:hypothetical protein